MMRLLLKGGADPDRADSSGRIGARLRRADEGATARSLAEIEKNEKPKAQRERREDLRPVHLRLEPKLAADDLTLDEIRALLAPLVADAAVFRRLERRGGASMRRGRPGSIRRSRGSPFPAARWT